MSNTVKNDFFGFPKVKWLRLVMNFVTVLNHTGKVGKCTSYRCQVFSGFNTPKSLKSVNFRQSYWKNKKVDVFCDTV